MLVATGVLLVLVLIGTVAVAMMLRSWGQTESRLETRLHDPQTHTVAYAVPNGVDPVVFKIALGHAGFTCVVDRVADAEYLLVECTEAQRPQVRDVLESVHSDELHGAALSLGDVVFEDER